mmetsp:Transcript_9027/g.15884  ORF Transcript_9027/g.15884 Transcript_9027/m.15884 type:complete len:83 (+) Transcript_9027:743-991(+)
MSRSVISSDKCKALPKVKLSTTSLVTLGKFVLVCNDESCLTCCWSVWTGDSIGDEHGLIRSAPINAESSSSPTDSSGHFERS